MHLNPVVAPHLLSCAAKALDTILGLHRKKTLYTGSAILDNDIAFVKKEQVCRERGGRGWHACMYACMHTCMHACMRAKPSARSTRQTSEMVEEWTPYGGSGVQGLSQRAKWVNQMTATMQIIDYQICIEYYSILSITASDICVNITALLCACIQQHLIYTWIQWHLIW